MTSYFITYLYKDYKGRALQAECCVSIEGKWTLEKITAIKEELIKQDSSLQADSIVFTNFLELESR